MKKILLSLLIVFSAPALKADGFSPYFAIRGGGASSSEKGTPIEIFSDPLSDYVFNVKGPAFGAAVGVQNDYLRFEFAYSYMKLRNNNAIFLHQAPMYSAYLTSQNITQQNFMLNVFFYPFKNWAIKPFIGGGIGVASLKYHYIIEAYDYFDDNVSGNGTAYSLYLGADWEITKHFALEIFGNYGGITAPFDYFPGQDSLYNIKTYGAYAGLRYKI